MPNLPRNPYFSNPVEIKDVEHRNMDKIKALDKKMFDVYMEKGGESQEFLDLLDEQQKLVEEMEQDEILGKLETGNFSKVVNVEDIGMAYDDLLDNLPAKRPVSGKYRKEDLLRHLDKELLNAFEVGADPKVLNDLAKRKQNVMDDNHSEDEKSNCNCESTRCHHGSGGDWKPCSNHAGKAKIEYVGSVCNECYNNTPKRFRIVSLKGEKIKHKDDNMATDTDVMMASQSRIEFLNKIKRELAKISGDDDWKRVLNSKIYFFIDPFKSAVESARYILSGGYTPEDFLEEEQDPSFMLSDEELRSMKNDEMEDKLGANNSISGMLKLANKFEEKYGLVKKAEGSLAIYTIIKNYENAADAVRDFAGAMKMYAEEFAKVSDLDDPAYNRAYHLMVKQSELINDLVPEIEYLNQEIDDVINEVHSEIDEAFNSESENNEE